MPGEVFSVSLPELRLQPQVVVQAGRWAASALGMVVRWAASALGQVVRWAVSALGRVARFRPSGMLRSWDGAFEALLFEHLRAGTS